LIGKWGSSSSSSSSGGSGSGGDDSTNIYIYVCIDAIAVLHRYFSHEILGRKGSGEVMKGFPIPDSNRFDDYLSLINQVIKDNALPSPPSHTKWALQYFPLLMRITTFITSKILQALIDLAFAVACVSLCSCLISMLLMYLASRITSRGVFRGPRVRQ